MFEIAVASGVIDDAPTLAEVFLRVLRWLLSIFLFLGIISLAFAGTLYLFAGGDASRLGLAKKALMFSLGGIGLGLGALILVRSITVLFAE